MFCLKRYSLHQVTGNYTVTHVFAHLNCIKVKDLSFIEWWQNHSIRDWLICWFVAEVPRSNCQRIELFAPNHINLFLVVVSFISIYRLKFNLNSLFIGFCFHSCFAMHFIAKSKWLIFFLCVIWCRSLLSDPNSWNVNNSLITSAAWILTLFPSFFFLGFFTHFFDIF